MMTSKLYLKLFIITISLVSYTKLHGMASSGGDFPDLPDFRNFEDIFGPPLKKAKKEKENKENKHRLFSENPLIDLIIKYKDNPERPEVWAGITRYARDVPTYMLNDALALLALVKKSRSAMSTGDFRSLLDSYPVSNLEEILLPISYPVLLDAISNSDVETINYLLYYPVRHEEEMEKEKSE